MAQTLPQINLSQNRNNHPYLTRILGEDFMQDLTMQVNATSHFWTVKSVLPGMMAANHGHIVTIASSAGMVGTLI